jgi:cytochrome c-type biogenesis protein CcmF
MTLSGWTIHLATVLAVASTVFYILALWRKRDYPAARYTYWGSTLFISLSMLFLLYHLFTRDFRLSYVAAYSSRDLSPLYTLSALWAGQEGSFLLWTWCALVLGLFLLPRLKAMEPLVMFFYNLPIVSLLLLLIRQTPFHLLEQVPADGKGMNPLLQNPWMAIHPPAMFVGYAAFGIPFAFVLALAVRKEFHQFVSTAYPWVVFAWLSLGFGIILGGFWAYETLGWGGFWGWDPVENASLIPWLIMSALLHGMVLERRFNSFHRTNYFLAVFAFIFILYGTFLTRSGVLQDFSVHSFVDLGITGLLLVILGFFLLLGAAVFAAYRRDFPAGEKIRGFWGPQFFLAFTAFLLLASGLFVTLGTSSPILSKLWGEPSKVGNDFYVITSIPVYLLIIAVMAVCPLFYARARRSTILGFGGAALLAAAASALWGVHHPLHILFIALCTYAFLAQWLWIKKMEIGFIHAGLAMFIVGAIFSTGYDTKEKLNLPQGQAVAWAGRQVTFEGFKDSPDGKSYFQLAMAKEGSTSEARPKLWQNPQSGQLVANPDIQKGLFTDLYLAAEQYLPPQGGNELALAKGETKAVGPYQVTFTGFQFGGGQHGMTAGGPMELGTALTVTKGAQTWSLGPSVSMGGAQAQPKEARLPEPENLGFRILGINADSKTVRLEVLGIENAGKAATAVVEAMHIPLINLVWLGSILAMLGGTISLWRHLRRPLAADSMGEAPVTARSEDEGGTPTGATPDPPAPEAPQA